MSLVSKGQQLVFIIHSLLILRMSQRSLSQTSKLKKKIKKISQKIDLVLELQTFKKFFFLAQGFGYTDLTTAGKTISLSSPFSTQKSTTSAQKSKKKKTK